MTTSGTTGAAADRGPDRTRSRTPLCAASVDDVPVTIGDDVQPAPGVAIAAGAPARRIRPITDADSATLPTSAVLGRLSGEQRPAGAGSD